MKMQISKLTVAKKKQKNMHLWDANSHPSDFKWSALFGVKRTYLYRHRFIH